ncbi:MAG: hypothetical protein PHD54_02825 [Desulfuromonadaceae bacterium]|nr:hypothetical protein [Desulfuromonadaceae bacterium]
MDIKSREYVKYFRVGEMAMLKIEDDSGAYQELTCIIAQVTDVSSELAIMYDELPAILIGQEVPAILSAMVGYLHCECPVVIGKNSFEQTAFARFAGEADIRIKRNYIRQDVLIPFLFEPLRSFEKARELILSRRAAPGSATFSCEPYGESFKAVAWQGEDDLLPLRINLGGGGVRFATVDPFQRNTFLALQIFLDWPQPRVIHALLKVIRSKPFEQTPEDRPFYNWAKIRLKSQTISITAGSYDYIEAEDRQFVIDYIQKIQSSNYSIVAERVNEP